MGVPGKKLLVLDVNGLLVDTYYAGDTRPERQYDKKVNKFYVYNRPFCDEFIHFCLENFVVGVWSSGLEHNVRAMVDYVFEESKEKLAFIWHQKHCTDTGFRHPENKHKPLFLKELWRLWKRVESSLPWNEGDFNPSNTVLIDDSPYKAINNPPHTAIFPKSYKALDVSDNFLEELQTYLEGMLDVSDVQAYIQTHPIGEPYIAVGDPQWSHVRTSVKFKIEGDWEVPDLWLSTGVIRLPKPDHHEEGEDTVVVKTVVTAPTLGKDDKIKPFHRDIGERLPRKGPKRNNHTSGGNGHSLPWHSYPFPLPSRDMRRGSAESDFVAAGGYPRRGVMQHGIASDPAPPGVEGFPNMQGHGMGPMMIHPDLDYAQGMNFGSKTDLNYAFAHPHNGPPYPAEGNMPLPRAGERRSGWHPYDRVSNGNYGMEPFVKNLHMRMGGPEGSRHPPGGWGNRLPRSENMSSQTSRMQLEGGDRFNQGPVPWTHQEFPEGRGYQNGAGGFPRGAGGPQYGRQQQPWLRGSRHLERPSSIRAPEMGVSGPPSRSSQDRRRWERASGPLSRRDDDARSSPPGFSPSRDDGPGGHFRLKSDGYDIIQVRGTTDPSDWLAREREEPASWSDQGSIYGTDQPGYEMVGCGNFNFLSDDPMRGLPDRRNIHRCSGERRNGQLRAADWSSEHVEPSPSPKSYGRWEQLLGKHVTSSDDYESLYKTAAGWENALNDGFDKTRDKKQPISEYESDKGLGPDDRSGYKGLSSDIQQAENELRRREDAWSMEKGNYQTGWSSQVGRGGDLNAGHGFFSSRVRVDWPSMISKLGKSRAHEEVDDLGFHRHCDTPEYEYKMETQCRGRTHRSRDLQRHLDDNLQEGHENKGRGFDVDSYHGRNRGRHFDTNDERVRRGSSKRTFTQR